MHFTIYWNAFKCKVCLRKWGLDIETLLSSRNIKKVRGFHLSNWNGHIPENALSEPEPSNSWGAWKMNSELRPEGWRGIIWVKGFPRKDNNIFKRPEIRGPSTTRDPKRLSSARTDVKFLQRTLLTWNKMRKEFLELWGEKKFLVVGSKSLWGRKWALVRDIPELGLRSNTSREAGSKQWRQE